MHRRVKIDRTTVGRARFGKVRIDKVTTDRGEDVVDEIGEGTTAIVGDAANRIKKVKFKAKLHKATHLGHRELSQLERIR